MSHIAPCPHCERPIQLASLALETQRVRCPLCAEPFAIGEVAALAIPAPPLAELYVDDLPELAFAAVAPLEMTAEEPLELDITGSSAEGAPIESADEIGDFLGSLDQSPDETADVVDEHLEMPPELDDPESLDDIQPDLEADWQPGEMPTFDLQEAEPAAEMQFESNYTPTQESVGARRRRAQKPAISPVVQVAGVAIGGIIGITVGYIILLIIGGITGRDTDVFGLWKQIKSWMGLSASPRIAIPGLIQWCRSLWFR